jgi:hypothetical protein
MTGMEWALWVVLASFYIMCLFTVCALTFQKGYTALGVVGIFFPFLWLIGALLPAKPGSQADVRQKEAAARYARESTQEGVTAPR